MHDISDILLNGRYPETAYHNQEQQQQHVQIIIGININKINTNMKKVMNSYIHARNQSMLNL